MWKANHRERKECDKEGWASATWTERRNRTKQSFTFTSSSEPAASFRSSTCYLSNLQAAQAAPVAPLPPAVPSPQQTNRHLHIIHSTHYNTDALPGRLRTRAFFSSGALISAMPLMAHYRPIHKYCLQYYHFQGLSAPWRFILLFYSMLLFSSLVLFFTPHPLFFHIPQFRATAFAAWASWRWRRWVFVPFRVETGPEEHQVTAATQQGEMQSCSIEQSNKWWQSALWLCGIVALWFSPLRSYAGRLMRPWLIFTSSPAPWSFGLSSLVLHCITTK